MPVHKLDDGLGVVHRRPEVGLQAQAVLVEQLAPSAAGPQVHRGVDLRWTASSEQQRAESAGAESSDSTVLSEYNN